MRLETVSHSHFCKLDAFPTQVKVKMFEACSGDNFLMKYFFLYFSDLSDNLLEGDIPFSISKLKQLELL